MDNLVNILEDLLDLKGVTSFELRVTPQIKAYINTLKWDLNSEVIKEFCNSLPKEDLTGVGLLKRHTGQNEFYAHLLMALGENLNVWKILPSPELSSGPVYSPFVQKPLKKKKDPPQTEEDQDSSEEDE